MTAMTAAAAPAAPPELQVVSRWMLIRFRARSLACFLSLTAIVLGFYGYWALWKLKVAYFGWAAACLVLLLVAVDPRPGMRLESKGFPRCLWPLVVWYGYLALSALWSPDPRTTLTFVGAQSICVMAFLVGYLWIRDVGAMRLSAYFVALSLMLLPIVLWSLLTTGKFYDESLGAVRTGVAAMVLAIPFLVWRARNLATPTSTASIGLVALAALLVAGSGSRSGALIGAFALFGSVAFVQRRRGRRVLGVALAVVSLAGLAALAMRVPSVRAGVLESAEKIRTETAFGIGEWIEADRFFTETGELPRDLDRRIQALVAA